MAKNKLVAKAIREITSSKRVNNKTLQKFKKNVNTFSGNDLDLFLESIFSYPVYRNYYSCLYFEEHRIFNKGIFKIHSQKRELLWYKNIFIKNENVINKFVKDKLEIDILILNSKAEQALKKIDEVIKYSGYSLWAIEYQTHIKKEFLSESNLTYLNQLKNINKTGEIDFFIQQLTLKSESKNIHSFVDNLLAQINLMRSTEEDTLNQSNDYADLFASYFLPTIYDPKRNIQNRTLSCMMSFPIIDQYLLFKRYIFDRKNFNGEFEKYEFTMIKNLSSYIKDDELINSLSDDVSVSDIDKGYLNIIKEYSYGNYNKVEQKINTLALEDPMSTVFIELNARNNIYLNKNQEGTLFSNLTRNVQNLLLLKDNYNSINFIESVSIKFNLSSWIYPIHFHLYSMINANTFQKEFSRNNMKFLGNKITPKCVSDFSFNKLFNYLNINVEDLPRYRYLKISTAQDSFDNKLIEKKFNIYEKECIIKIDYLCERAYYLINNNMIEEATIFFVEKYLENEFVYNILPFTDLIKKIENLNIDVMRIHIPIIYDIYNKKIVNDKQDERRETYEDYIDSFNEYKPSKIFSNSKFLKKEEVYFLKYVAIPSIMDISSEYDSSSDLKVERLEILNILDSLIEDEDISIEKDNILDELIFEEIKASFNSSKLYVDVESLKADKEFEYKRLYDIFEATKILYKEDDNLTEEEDINKNFITLKKTDEQELIMPSSELSDIIVQIYKRILEDFVQNENYGLNKYLSTEIRHDVFFTQLRTAFEKYNLLTEVGLDNEYEDNQHWGNEYSIVTDSIVVPMLNRLNEFSKDIDTLLKEANSWFNVKDISENGGMFDFISTYERLTSLKKTLIKVDSFNSFFDACILYMWELTYSSSIKIKQRLEEDFKEQMISLINDLGTDINYLRGKVKVKKLTDAIELSKGQITEDINIVSSWLNKVEEDTQKYSIFSIIKECINMFKDTMIHKNITININEELELFDINLSYIESRSMMLSVYISLNNCIKYGSNINDEFIINLDILNINYSKMRILVKNKINLMNKEKQDQLIFKLKEKLSDKYKNLSTKEGGTGLHKIFNLLSNISDRFNIDVSIEENEFILLIEVNCEDNNN